MPTIQLSRFEPIPFISRPGPFDSPDWLFEPLYDGRRALLHVHDGTYRIEPADHRPVDGLADLPDRMAGLLPAVEAVLDGQVLALDSRGRPLRNPAGGQGFLAFAAFDLLWLDRDLRPLPLAERKAALRARLPRDTGSLFKLFALEEHGRALFAAARRLDLDGIVARRLADPYTPDSVWYAIRNPAAGQAEAKVDPFARREPSRRHRRVATD